MSELPGVMVGRQAAVPTPLPRTTVASLLLVILGTAFNLNVLFPFVAWMVADFLPDRDFTNVRECSLFLALARALSFSLPLTMRLLATAFASILFTRSYFPPTPIKIVRSFMRTHN